MIRPRDDQFRDAAEQLAWQPDSRETIERDVRRYTADDIPVELEDGTARLHMLQEAARLERMTRQVLHQGRSPRRLNGHNGPYRRGKRR